MKKSFILHIDSLCVLDDLTNEQIGELFKAIRDYQKGEEKPLTGIVKVAFSPFKNQFERDKESYEKICNRNKTNGLKGGRPKEKEEPKETQETQSVFKEPKKADSDSDSVNDSVSKNDNVNDINKRKADFKKSLLPFLEKYGKEMLKSFFEYWSEHGAKDKKMRFEKEKSFGIERRLETWIRNEKKWSNEKPVEKKLTFAEKIEAYKEKQKQSA